MKKLHTSVIASRAYRMLKEVMQDSDFNDFYLAGGTALALQLGHRMSEDLDLFSNKGFKSNLTDVKFRDAKVISKHNNSIELIIDNTKTFFFYFAYQLKNKLQLIDSVRLADPVDIGFMKLLALQGRTTRKDIIDLYFIHKLVIPLDKLLNMFESNYPKETFSSYDSLKSLMDTSTLTDEPMPEMLAPVDWDQCLQTVEQILGAHLLGKIGIVNKSSKHQL